MNVVIYDIETLLELFSVGIYCPEEDKYYEFEVSVEKNTLDGFIRYTEKYEDYYFVGYNNLSFDSQVVEWILRNHYKWNELSSLEICAKIAQKANDVIHDSNFGLFSEYIEEWLTLKQIDLFKIWHYDNKNRMVGLKRLEFEMDFPNIEEMSIHHMKKNISSEERKDILMYMKNDVMATYEFYKITIGDTEHALYRDNNQIEIRQSIEEEFGIPCLNYSNSKIGDEIIKKFYCEEKGIKYSELPKKGTFRKSIELKKCIPLYINFQTEQLQEFLKRIKKITLSQMEDFVESIKFYGQEYTFAKGGLHNVINGKIYEANEEEELIDEDVSGFYPASIINNSYYPAHLGKSFLAGYKKVYDKRILMKPLAKKDKKIKGIVLALKDAGNCPYGKSSEMTSWLYDKQMTLATCLTGELSLLMLIEDMELSGIKCIMANTDGATFIVPKNKKEIYNKNKANWLEETTNILTYELEQVPFKKMVFSSVNDYIAIKCDGEIKMKGDFMKDFELHKNKSARIVPLALEQYYVNNIPIEEFISSHKNIYDFAIRQKASRDFHYEGINKGKENTIYNKLIRYYVSNTGEKLIKVKNPECMTNAAKISQVEAGEWVCEVKNFLPKDFPTTNVNFSYYIEKANRIISKIKLEGRKNKVVVIPGQISMF